MLTTTQNKKRTVCLSNATGFWSAALQDTGRNYDEQHNIRNGYGACSKCNCPGFEGTQDICSNCGHNYSAHW